MRIGIGYDVHRLIEDRDLIVGGVKIPHDKGLLGHSDGDVLLHSIMDSLLGALSLGDIGKHFPPTDPIYKDADSMDLLKHVAYLISEKGYHVENIDSVIICEAPKMAPFILMMEEMISECLGIRRERVSVKATTEEGLGFTGKGEGIAAKAVCLLEEDEDANI